MSTITIQQLLETEIIAGAPFVVEYCDEEGDHILLYDSNDPIARVKDEPWFSKAHVFSIYPDQDVFGVLTLTIELDPTTL